MANPRDRHHRHWEDEERRLTDHHGQGQSGYMAGRLEGDPSLDRPPWDNYDPSRSAGVNTDERFVGRGRGAWYGRTYDDERYGYGYGHGDERYDARFGDPRYREEPPSRPWPIRTSPYATQNYGRRHAPDHPIHGGHRGKGPKGFTRSDDRIREQVSEALQDDDHIDASGIEVHVRHGEVVLSGVVDDRATKRLAEDVVDRVPGVRDVQNQLRIERPWFDAGNRPATGTVGKPDGDDRRHRA